MKNVIEKIGKLSKKSKIIIAIVVVFCFVLALSTSGEKPNVQVESAVVATTPIENLPQLYEVVNVVDGDTIDVSIDRKTERLRLIGIDTPETVDPRKPVQCFGKEASNRSKELLMGKKVSLESDSTQEDRDKYDRLLRYVFLEDGTNFNLKMIKDGYAHEYTYDVPYKYQAGFKEAQKQAMTAKAGLWGDICQVKVTPQPSISPIPTPPPMKATVTNSCTIKGNISTNKEKIYHIQGCGSYAKTAIDESKGERWFCSEQEAVEAGWRKAQNCN